MDGGIESDKWAALENQSEDTEADLELLELKKKMGMLDS